MGLFKITRVVPRQYAEMTRNESYWNAARIPKLERMVVYPMPEPTTRMAALRSGQVNWIEVPPPDAIPSLKKAGFQISLWPYPHTYPYVLNCAPGDRVQRREGSAGDELRDRPCWSLRHAQWNGQTGVRILPAGTPVIRQACAALWIRSGAGEGSAAAGGLWAEPTSQGEDHDLDIGFGADGADPDQRVSATELCRGGFRCGF